MNAHMQFNSAFVRASNGVLLGAGLCFAIQTENYLHIPLVVLFPPIYAGYHAYKNKDAIVDTIDRLMKQRKMLG